MEVLNLALTIVLFLISLFLILLVLVQLPKKEAGLGTAFGGGTTDALFGAGAGNVLTKLTKYCTILFLVLCLALSIMNKRTSPADGTADNQEKQKQEQPGQPAGTPIGGGNDAEPTIPETQTPTTNAPAPAPSTNAPAPSTNAPAPEAPKPEEGEGEEDNSQA